MVYPSLTVDVVEGENGKFLCPIYRYSFPFSISIVIRNCSHVEQENQDMH